ncbi:MAG: hypothetical protein AAFP23_10335, partial [Pseudomonadota bacterium]
LEATIVLPQPGPDAMRRTVATAATLSFSRVEGDSEQNTGRLALDAEGLVLTSRIALGPEPRDRRISLQSGPLTARLSAGLVPGARVAGAEVGGSLDIAAATAAALATLTDGAMEATTTLDEITATLVQTDPEALGGTARLDRLDLGVAQPVVDEPRPGETISTRISAGILELDEALWTQIDPNEALQRRPGLEMHLELRGTLREGVPATAGWLAAERVAVDGALTGLGAEGETALEISFDETGIPGGGGNLRFFNAMGLMRDLLASGLVAPEQAEMVFFMASRFARPGETVQELVVDVELRDGVLFLTRQPIAGLPPLPIPR